MENQVHFEILQVATTQKLQRFTVNQCVVICGYSAVLIVNRNIPVNYKNNMFTNN